MIHDGGVGWFVQVLLGYLCAVSVTAAAFLDTRESRKLPKIGRERRFVIVNESSIDISIFPSTILPSFRPTLFATMANLMSVCPARGP